MIGIITALPQEARCFKQRRVCVCGMGAERAEVAAQQLIQQGATALLSWGTAGGLEPQLRPGDLVMPKEVITSDNKSYLIDSNWHADIASQIKLTIHDGKLIHSEKIISSPLDKKNMFADYRVIATDMESAGVAKAAAAAGIPFLVIRVIVDPAEQVLPSALIGALKDDGRVLHRKLIINLMKQPRQILEMLQLARHFAAAQKTMKQVATYL